MSKRFTDSDKWGKPWFRCLPPEQKCFWNYICDQCDLAGVWDVDFRLARVYIGKGIKEAETREAFKKQFIEFKPGKWWIKDFCDFQYGELKESQNFHRAVVATLKRHGLWDVYLARDREVSGADEGLTSPIVQGQGQGQGQGNKDRVVKGKTRFLDFVLLTEEEHGKLVEQFGIQGVNERIARLNEYGHQKPKKFKEYGSHYHTILAWARKDPPKTEAKIVLTKQQQSNLQQLEDLSKEIANDKRSV